MKALLTSSNFAGAICTASRAVASAANLPILSFVRIELKSDGAEGKMVVTATDLDLGLTVETEALSVQPGVTTCSARKLAALAGEMNGDVSIKQDGKRSIIECGGSLYKMFSLPAEEFPVLPTMPAEEGIEITEGLLKGLLETVSYCQAEADKYVMNSVLFEKTDGHLTLVATDGRRMAVATMGCPGGAQFSIIIPTKAIKLLHSLLKNEDEVMEIRADERQAFFIAKSWTLSTKLVEGKYPNWQQVIPEKVQGNVVDRAPLLAALVRVKQLTSDKCAVVKLEFKGGEVELSVNNPDLGNGREVWELPDAFAAKVKVNPNYLEDILRSVRTEQIEVEIEDDKSPIVIRGANFTHVLMPLRD